MPEQRNDGSANMTKPKNGEARNVNIGLFSRIDFGSPGFRAKLVRRVREQFEKRNTDFDILVGGLVDKDRIHEIVNGAIREAKHKAKEAAAGIKADLETRRANAKSAIEALRATATKLGDASDEAAETLRDADRKLEKLGDKVTAADRKAKEAAVAEARAAFTKAREAETHARDRLIAENRRLIDDLKQATKDAKERMAAAKRVDVNGVIETTIHAIAQELAELLPRRTVPNSKKSIRLYIMVSPAYDGIYAEHIATELTQLRDDVSLWAGTSEYFPLKPAPHESFRELVCLVSTARAFYSKYASTPVDRIVERHVSRGTKKLGDVIIVGCCGSAVYTPKGGENPRPVISVPDCYRMNEDTVKDSPENQIGGMVLELTTDGKLFRHNIAFNDLVLKERETLHISDKFTSDEQRVLEKFRERSSWTLGLLEAALGKPREEIEKVLANIMRKNREQRLQPPMRFDSRSRRYFIDPQWVQYNLDYPYPDEKQLLTEHLIAFGCLHALCKHTDHEFAVREVAALMLKHGATTLAGVGDFIEGLEHGLATKGEVIYGANYTQQERFAAWIVAETMLRVFETRFTEAKRAKKIETAEDVASLIKETLPLFLYIPGNHCEWVERYGVVALTTFRNELIGKLQTGVWEVLKRHRLPLLRLDKLIEEKVVKADAYTLPSGISTSLTHLHMARAATKSLRSQSILGFRDAMVNLHANFHTEHAIDYYEPVVGQRTVLQLGTEKRGSGFEKRKGKKVDFGVGYLAASAYRGKVVKTTVAFFGDDKTQFKPFSNDEALKAYAKSVGIRAEILD